MNMRSHVVISAVACAGLVAWLSGFVSQQVVAPQALQNDAVKIEVAATAAPAVAEAAAPEAAPVVEAAATVAADAPAVAPAVVEAAAPAPAAAAPAAADAAALTPEAVKAMIAAADVTKGKTVAKACMACHNFDAGGKNGVGPNLHGVVGRKKESVAGFAFSGALSKQGGAVWTEAELFKYLEKPKAYAPGTKMTFAGIKKPEDRAAVIAYLSSLK